MARKTKSDILSGEVQVVFVTDVHVGSKLGICPRGFKSRDGEIVGLNRLQEISWEHWGEVWSEIEKSKKPTVIILGGEMIDNNHHNTHEIWTPAPKTMRDAAIELLKPVCHLPNVVKVYGVLGTPVHSGQVGEHDEEVYRDIGAVPIGSELYYGVHDVRLHISGVLFDVAHQGPPPGRYPQSLGNSARLYAKAHIDTAYKRGIRPPDAILRGHFHRKILETVTDQITGHRCEMVIGPGWQWKTEFTYRVDAIDKIGDVGLTIIPVCDGQIGTPEFKTVSYQQTKEVVA